MKINEMIFILIFSLISYTNNICIEGQNCPFGQGFCLTNKCQCFNEYWSVINEAEQTSPIYCNYKKYNRFYILIIEFFLPCIGHLIAGKYYFFIIKFLLLFCPIIYFVIGFFFYRKDDDGDYNKNINNWEPSREDILQNNNDENSLDEALHKANREYKDVNKLSQIPLMLSFFCLIAFLFMHLIDLICYSFGVYYDGKGAPML